MTKRHAVVCVVLREHDVVENTLSVSFLQETIIGKSRDPRIPKLVGGVSPLRVCVVEQRLTDVASTPYSVIMIGWVTWRGLWDVGGPCSRGRGLAEVIGTVSLGSKCHHQQTGRET